MKFKKTIVTGFVIFSAIGAALSANHNSDNQTNRKTAMVNIGFGASQLVPMIRGDKEFDPVIAKIALRMTQSSAIAFIDKFPEGSQSKGTNSDIWENKADFDIKVAEFVANANKAVQVDPQDLGMLKIAYEPLLKNCSACHKPYRIKYE